MQLATTRIATTLDVPWLTSTDQAQSNPRRPAPVVAADIILTLPLSFKSLGQPRELASEYPDDSIGQRSLTRPITSGYHHDISVEWDRLIRRKASEVFKLDLEKAWLRCHTRTRPVWKNPATTRRAKDGSIPWTPKRSSSAWARSRAAAPPIVASGRRGLNARSTCSSEATPDLTIFRARPVSASIRSISAPSSGVSGRYSSSTTTYRSHRRDDRSRSLAQFDSATCACSTESLTLRQRSPATTVASANGDSATSTGPLRPSKRCGEVA